MAENKTALEVMEESKARMEKKLMRLQKRLNGGSVRSKLYRKIDDIDAKIAKLEKEKDELQDEIANLVEDTIDTKTVEEEISTLTKTIEEYERAIEILKK